MTVPIRTVSYPAPDFDRKEILRYAGGGHESPETCNLLEECISELEGKIAYRVCYRTFEVCKKGELLDLGFASVDSQALKKNLSGCYKIVLFAATVGLEIDRLIARYGRVSPAKALMFQAIGAERIESLCDVFNAEIKACAKESGYGTRPRFSPGYGDLPIQLQRDIFNVLDCPRKIGLSLNDSFLMSPSKSVTALIGIGKCVEENESAGKCRKCENINCLFRSE